MSEWAIETRKLCKYYSGLQAVDGLDMSIMLIIFLIDMGLVYGLMYCVGAITRSGSRALIGSAILSFGY
jgi:hypothetical protein